MLTVALWLWGKNSGPSHKWDSFFRFEPEMLVRMAEAVRRNLHLPHRILAITDLPRETIPEWIDHLSIQEHFGEERQLGGCWLRLKAFAPDLLQVSNTRLQGPASRHQRDAAGWLASA